MMILCCGLLFVVVLVDCNDSVCIGGYGVVKIMAFGNCSFIV